MEHNAPTTIQIPGDVVETYRCEKVCGSHSEKHGVYAVGHLGAHSDVHGRNI